MAVTAALGLILAAVVVLGLILAGAVGLVEKKRLADCCLGVLYFWHLIWCI